MPDEYAPAVSRVLAELFVPAEPVPAEQAVVKWTEDLALEAIKGIVSRAEYYLVWRMAEARGQRVPMSELAASLGLPGTPDTAQDFAGLSAWCSARSGRPAVPVSSGGAGADGWYWMPIEAADRFLSAFAQHQKCAERATAE